MNTLVEKIVSIPSLALFHYIRLPQTQIKIKSQPISTNHMNGIKIEFLLGYQENMTHNHLNLFSILE